MARPYKGGNRRKKAGSARARRLRKLADLVLAAQGIRKTAEGNRPMPPPPHPTSTCPGTEWKIRVMTWRVANGYSPHHPQDYVEKK